MIAIKQLVPQEDAEFIALDSEMETCICTYVSSVALSISNPAMSIVRELPIPAHFDNLSHCSEVSFDCL